MLDKTKWPRKVGLLAERPSCGVDESFLRDIYFTICSTICHIFRGDTSDKQHHNIVTFCTNYLLNFVFSKAQSQSKTRRIIFNNIWQKSKKNLKKKKQKRKLNINPKLVGKSKTQHIIFNNIWQKSTKKETKQKTQFKSKTCWQKSGFHSQLPQSTGDTELIHQNTETN